MREDEDDSLMEEPAMHSSFSALRAMLTEQNVALQRHDAAHLKTSLAALASSSAKLKGRIGESLAFAGEMTSKMEDTRLQGREQAEIDKQRLTALSEFLRKHAAESGKATGADEAQRLIQRTRDRLQALQETYGPVRR